MSQIDEFFKDNLNNKGIQYQDAYWDDMEKLLDKRQKKKFILFFSSMAAIVFGLLVGLTLYLSDTNTRPKVTAAVSEKAIAPLKKEPNVSEITSADYSNNLPSANIEEPEKITETSSDKQLVEFTVHPIENRPVNISKGKQRVVSQPTEQIEQPQPVTNNSQPAIPEPLIVKSEDDSRLGFCFFAPLEKLQPDYQLSFITYQPAFLVVKKPVLSAISEKKDSMKLKAKWQYFIAPGYEYDKYTRTANQTGLKANEKTLNSSGYNLNFIARKNHWGFKTGGGILQFSELTNYVSTNKSYAFDTSYRMVDANFGQTPAGTRIALIKRLIDTTTTLSTSINNPDSKVKLTYFKIPLIASYSFSFKRLGVFVDAGINTALLLQRRGDYTTFADNKYKVENAKTSNDFNKVLFQSYTAIGLRYQLAKSFNIYGGYGLSQSLNSMTKSYNQKPKLNLFTLGLEIKLR